MVAISTDIDQTRIDALRETHRFMNTNEKTLMGPGLGLDIANSMWFYKPPAKRPVPPSIDSVAYFTDLSWEAPSPFAEELVHYARSGWIDTLHSYGNFSDSTEARTQFVREHAVRALEVMERNGVRFQVWVNHGNRFNRQNIGPRPFMEGDCPESSAYHADITRRHGIEFHWRGADYEPGGPSAIRPLKLNDGSNVFGFRRYQWRRGLAAAVKIAAMHDLNFAADKKKSCLLHVWLPQALPHQLAEEVLNSIVEAQRICVFGQHLGAISPMLHFDKQMIGALRNLRRFQDRGLILVARTSRLLNYNRIRDHLKFTWTVMDNRLFINIEEVVDPVRGRWVPSIEDLRGITFETKSPYPIVLGLVGVPIDPKEIRTALDNRFISISGIEWFKPDYTHHAAAFVARERQTHVLCNKGARDAAKSESDEIVALLRAEDSAIPADVDTVKYRSAINYATGRYEIGLARYMSALERIGFTDLRRGLDIGCGIGQWSVAFLHHNREVVGIDIRPEFVRIARLIAERCGLADGRALPLTVPKRLQFGQNGMTVPGRIRY